MSSTLHKKCSYGWTFCDHSWMSEFLFHDEDDYLFERELFRLFEEAVKRGNSHPNRLCRGRYADGTACDNCERCRSEMRSVEFNVQLDLRVRYDAARDLLMRRKKQNEDLYLKFLEES